MRFPHFGLIFQRYHKTGEELFISFAPPRVVFLDGNQRGIITTRQFFSWEEIWKVLLSFLRFTLKFLTDCKSLSCQFCSSDGSHHVSRWKDYKEWKSCSRFLSFRCILVYLVSFSRLETNDLCAQRNFYCYFMQTCASGIIHENLMLQNVRGWRRLPIFRHCFSWVMLTDIVGSFSTTFSNVKVIFCWIHRKTR